jgi:hypothetical protein
MISKKQMREFLKKLDSPEGCNFRKVEGMPKGEDITWTCNAHISRPLSHAILHSMNVSETDIKEIMKVAEKGGGYCDCEILFNAQDALMKAAK